MTRFGESPRLLQVFAIAWLAWFALSSLLYGGGAPIRIYVFAFMILATIAAFLLHGSRIAWVLVVLTNGVSLVASLREGDWRWAIFHLALLVLLFTPAVRRYIWRQRL